MDPDNNDYATPAEIWRPLSRAVGGFDLDAASGAECPVAEGNSGVAPVERCGSCEAQEMIANAN